jgi:prepilin-type N-terminal cleavage/methylation domain-containing protein
MMKLERRSKKRWQRGLMLIEVLVVVAIMAIMAATVAFAVIPIYVDHQKKIAKQSASSLRLVVGTWRMSHYGEDCPDFARLRADKIVDRESSDHDPWGSPYVIRCADDDVTVISAGPDKKMGTADDIVAPPEAAVARER